MLGTIAFPPHLPVAFKSRPRGATAVRAAVAEFPPRVALENRSLYEILRVRSGASQTEIKSAYRALAKLYHPDAASTDGRDFIEIHDAYATLSDPDARAVYDLNSRVDSQRRRRSAAGMRSRYDQSQRWETDQCW